MNTDEGAIDVQTTGTDASASYVIAGGETGRARLRMLSGVIGATTERLLDRVEIADDARCLDAGCGGGDVTRLLAARVPFGSVVGVDRDPVKIALAGVDAPENVTLRVEELVETVASEERFDMVYARFVLSHLADAAGWVAALARLVVPGGALALEDIRIGGSFCSPQSDAFDRSLAIYSATVRANGGDPEVGPHLPRFLALAGLDDIGIEVVQPAAMAGDAKRIQRLTLIAIRDTAIAAGTATGEEIDGLASELDAFIERTDTVVTTAQIVQTWARRPI